MPPKSKPKRRPRSRDEQLAHLGQALSTLVVLAESAAELHCAAARTACVISDLLDELNAIEESKPRLLRAK